MILRNACAHEFTTPGWLGYFRVVFWLIFSFLLVFLVTRKNLGTSTIGTFGRTGLLDENALGIFD
jgi:hypothetical protein